jgi:phosphatidylserine/phosphatidylglycerophosphate/cardiolipin synthase-like enzyme
MHTKTILQLLVAVFTILSFGACSTNNYLSDESRSTGVLSTATIEKNASAGPMTIHSARVISSNEEAFLSKLEMVSQAQDTIDAAYYIVGDDYTSSAFSAELIAAARRGVRVRLLLDYHSTYKDLDLFSMMEKRGSEGSGSLQVRFYNRPTRNIVMDAAYITSRCSDLPMDSDTLCRDAKLSAIIDSFDAEIIDGQAAADIGISNLNIGASGLFLSGLYTKNPELMALAMMPSDSRKEQGAPVDFSQISGDDLDGLAKIAGIWWKSRTGNIFQRLVTKIELAFIFAVYGDVLDQMYSTIAEKLPIERRNLEEAVRDWDYITDYMHQKLLLADTRYLQLGGRNMEDTYNLSATTQPTGQLFVDTDVYADLATGGASVEAAFERLWNFRTMVASVAEIRQHAPNDFAANTGAIRKAKAACENAPDAEDNQSCFEREFSRHAESQESRESRHYDEMTHRAEHFSQNIRPKMIAEDVTTIEIGTAAELFYVENIPFSGEPEGPLQGRSFGSRNGQEGKSGKRIHSLALTAMESVCKTATVDNPQRVILINAYFFPPSNLVDTLTKMLDGRLDCRHVDVKILTNSIQSTDLAITNLFARHVALAFSDYIHSVRDPEKSASLDFLELQLAPGPIKYSLHSKVWVLGDDLLVGSANADVRSYMMDANNAIMIRGSSDMVKNYIEMVDQILADPARTKNLSAYYQSVSREEVIDEDLQGLRGFLQSSGISKKLSSAQMAEVEKRFVDLLNLVYSLTHDGLEGGAGSQKAQDRFNRIFKLI